jgi:hypothetical protein
MAHNIAEDLRRMQEELRVVKAELAALSCVLEEAVLCHALAAVDTAGASTERVAAAVRVLKKVADMGTAKSSDGPGSIT